MELTQGQISDPKTALAFILAGKATVTFRSLQSGNRYTYKITAAKKDPNKAPTWFVKLLNGSDNYSNYVYIGFIRDNQFVWSGRCGVGKDAPSIIGFTYVFGKLVANVTNGFEVWHEGKCGRCGKKLTVPESIASGFGPDCLQLVGGAAILAPVTVAGSIVTPKLDGARVNFDGSIRKPRVNGDAARYERLKKFCDANENAGDAKFLALADEAGISVDDLQWFSVQQLSDPDYNKPAVNGTPVSVPKPIAIGNIDAEIRRRIAEYKANAPEDYYHDGELNEKEAFNVAYNKFRVQIEREQVGA